MKWLRYLVAKWNTHNDQWSSIVPILRKFKLPISESFIENNSIHFLNISQFFGVINDNVYKFLTALLFIHLSGPESRALLLSLAGLVYVLPFLLFSSFAGILADRFSKQKLIVFLKLVEIVVILIGIIAFSLESKWLSYFMIFLLGAQSAFFGPPKYSIISELVKSHQISKANGAITSLSTLGMILASFLGPFLLQVTNDNYIISALILLLFSVIGYIASLFIKITPPSLGEKQFTLFFFSDIIQTLRECWPKKMLVLAISVSSFFFYLGAFFQINVIPFGVQMFGFPDREAGYLFGATSIGLALGATLSGRLCKVRVELGLPCLGLLGMGLTTIVMMLGSFWVGFTILSLAIIGFFGGLIVVPLDSYIQSNSPEKQRGQIIAANNFITFTGILLASVSVMFLSEGVGLNAAESFLFLGFINVLAALIVIRILSNLFFNYLSRMYLSVTTRLSVNHFPFQNNQPLVLVDEAFSPSHVVFLAAYHPDILLFVQKDKKRFAIDWFIELLTGIRFIYEKDSTHATLEFLEQAPEPQKKIPTLLVYSDISMNKAQFLQKKRPFLLEHMQTHVLLRKDQPAAFLKRTQVTITISTKSRFSWFGMKAL